MLFLYTFEDFLLKDKHYSNRHWDFVKQSLEDLNQQLLPYSSKVLVVNNSIETVIYSLSKNYHISHIFSHQETGLLNTFKRDLSFSKFCKTNHIQWIENENNAIQRGLKNRINWVEHWELFMNSEEFEFLPKKINYYQSLR